MNLATRAAAAGAAEVVSRVAAPGATTTKSSATDPVTDADRASEDAIVELIRRHRPSDEIIGEERGHRSGSSGYRWVIDPLDGTVNFLYGIPAFAVSVACEILRDGTWVPWVGVVHDIGREETFSAAAGLGARMNGAVIQVGSVEALAAALITTGFSYEAASRARQARALCALLPAVRDIRSGGSAAIELCWVASGRFDAYFEDELAIWDTAAGKLIVAEAGGRTTSLGVSGIIASNTALHHELKTRLSDEVAQ
ncbi:inositol monophosphatase family protein [Pseudarthrobacter sp. O4]|uniref:inositol monophosphatase family protein n=1 Tax=Pseudarthrobacter sp. O4 TaxID=3418417 RepID=UPI003CF102FA